MRKEINSLVHAYAKANNGCYEAAWNKIYKELNRRNHLNIKARARNKKIRPLDIAEQMGLLNVLAIIAIEVL